MISTLRFGATPIAQVVVVMLTVHTLLACSEGRSASVCDKLPLSTDPITAPAVRRPATSAQWKGREYDVESGIAVLMDAVRHPENGTNERQLALLELAALQRNLDGNPCIDELAELYERVNESEKYGILICFKSSRDPRAIPLFVHVLDNEKSMKLRLSAASGLAGWNIHRGVAELMNLLDSKEILPQPARMMYVRHNASESFRNANARKGWGFRFEEIGQPIGQRTDLSADEKASLFVAEIRKWWAENEHRFPDWKVGDPLPEVSAGDNNKATKE